VSLTRVRIGVLAVAYAVVGVAAGGIFDRVDWGLVAAPCIPLALIAAVAPRRPGVRVLAALFGVAIATAIAVALAGGGVDDLVDAWTVGTRRLLSTEWPSPRRADLVGVVAVGLCATAAASGVLTTWQRWHLLPLAPTIVAYVTVVGLSSPLGVRPYVLAVLGAAAVVFATLRNDGSLRDRWLLLRGERRLVVLVAIAALLALAISLPLSFAVRADPRRDDPAADSAPLLDPIEASIALRKLAPVIALHVITPVGAQPLPPDGFPTRWRTAALSNYDGRRWTPTLTLRPIGGTLGPATADTVNVEVSFERDDLSLVPLPGAPIRIGAAVETDIDRTVVRLVDRPEPGQVVNLAANVEADGIDSTGTPVAIRPIDESVAGFTGLAQSLGGDAAVLAQLVQIEQTMHDEFVLDPDVQGGGLQRVLIDRFLRDTQRGNTEQFATAFVLLARSLGVEARVATGFIVDPSASDASLTLLSSDAVIWPEIGLADGRWVAFDPVPDQEAGTDTPPEPEPQVQTPAAPQPPIELPPESPNDTPEPDETVDDSADDALSTFALWAARGAAIGGVLVLPVVLVAGLILGAKYRRRRRRLRALEPVDRIRGAWASATDDLVDAGLVIAPSATDGEIASSSEPLAPDARRELHRLALLSSAATYGAPNRADLLSQDAVVCLTTIDKAIRRPRTRWQRVRWRLSIRSLRSATRSPLRT
jgi:Transglutaminase-like superfamily/TgpA N-terminal domain